MSDFVDDAVARLRAAGLLDEPRGCSDEEIARLEAARGLKLPPAYRRFLGVMGNGAGEFLRGTDWLFAELPGLQDQEWLEDDCFVFFSHQGYQLLYFHCDGTEDPPVWLYDDDDDESRQVAAHFSEYLTLCVGDEIAAAASLK